MTEPEPTRKVWIVAHGEYSDWNILGIFDDRELAAQFKDQVGADNDLLEYELNPFRAKIQEGLRKFRVSMDRDGNTIDEEQKGPSTGIDDSWWQVDEDDRIHDEKEDGRYCRAVGREFKPTGRTWIDLYVFARDVKHAVKIVNDRRRQLIAEGKWPPGPIAPTTKEIRDYLDRLTKLADENRAKAEKENPSA